jgi:UDP-2,3-diacylglucosamine hydrolase
VSGARASTTHRSRAPLPEIEIAPESAFVADLHLDPWDERGAHEFAGWIAGLSVLQDLLILGDLFDVWVGPAQERLPGATVVFDALHAIAVRGTRVHVVPGNRDFLLGRSFERRTRARVHADGCVVQWSTSSGRACRCAAVHGDLLCTRDRGYQRLRRVLRSKPLMWLAPRLPLPIGALIARCLRRASVQALQYKLSDEKSMQATAARELAQATGADVVICGHAHRAQDERLSSGPRWIVLDAFGGERDVARLSFGGELCLGSHAHATGRAAR